MSQQISFRDARGLSTDVLALAAIIVAQSPARDYSIAEHLDDVSPPTAIQLDCLVRLRYSIHPEYDEFATPVLIHKRFYSSQGSYQEWHINELVLLEIQKIGRAHV